MSDHPFHAGELAAQQRFTKSWSEEEAQRRGRIMRRALDDEMTAFIEQAPFFFLATADRSGHCDCSFKGRDPDASGALLAVARTTSPTRLIFPDYEGNGLYNSLGNLLENPHAGMIFIDFGAKRRLRVNGGATLMSDADEWHAWWPGAQRAVEIRIEQAYWNCARRIPQQP